MKTVMKPLLLITSMLLISLNVFALDLAAAKTNGMVGETQNGYLKAKSSATEVQALVDDINAKRKATYQALAKKNALTVAQVEKLAGEKAIKRTEAGHYIYVGGNWIKK